MQKFENGIETLTHPAIHNAYDLSHVDSSRGGRCVRMSKSSYTSSTRIMHGLFCGNHKEEKCWETVRIMVGGQGFGKESYGTNRWAEEILEGVIPHESRVRENVRAEPYDTDHMKSFVRNMGIDQSCRDYSRRCNSAIMPILLQSLPSTADCNPNSGPPLALVSRRV